MKLWRTMERIRGDGSAAVHPDLLQRARTLTKSTSAVSIARKPTNTTAIHTQKNAVATENSLRSLRSPQVALPANRFQPRAYLSSPRRLHRPHSGARNVSDHPVRSVRQTRVRLCRDRALVRLALVRLELARLPRNGLGATDM